MANIINQNGQVKVGFKTPPLYPSFVTSGLTFSFDAYNTTSYPGTGNIWYDISGNNRNMTLSPQVVYPVGTMALGPVWNNTGGIKRFSFNQGDGGWGTGAYAGFSYSPSITNGFTFGGWAKTLTNGSNTFVKGVDGRYGGWDMIFSLGSTSVGLTILNTSYQGVGLNGNITLTNNTWYYIIAQYIHNVGLKIYVNGVLANSLNQPGLRIVNRGTGWAITNVATNITGNAAVSTYHMYTRILDDSEILQNFNAYKSRYGY